MTGLDLRICSTIHSFCFLDSGSCLKHKRVSFGQLKAVILYVLRFGWLLFGSEEGCTKAHKDLQTAKLKGKPINVDFCGQRSKSFQDRKDHGTFNHFKLLQLLKG